MLVIGIPGVLFALLLAVCLIPVDLNVRFNSARSPLIRFHIGWLFHVVKFRIGKKANEPAAHKKSKSRKEKRETGKRAKKKRRSGFRVARFLTYGLFLRILRLIHNLISAIHFREIAADITAGTGEPADTGIVWGWLSPLFVLLPVSLRKQIRLAPDFGHEPVLIGNAKVTIRIWPIEIIFVVLKFVLSGPVLSTIKKIIIFKWKNRN